MKERDMEFAKQWLKKAEHDLITARHVLNISDGPTDTPCFHAQQTVEKSLKALLTAYGTAFERVHDLMPLLDVSTKFMPELAQYREPFAELSSYAVEARYPTGDFEPSRADAKQALSVAEAVFEIIRNHLKTMGVS